MAIAYQEYQLIDPSQCLDPLTLLLIAEDEEGEADAYESFHQGNVVTPPRQSSDDAFD